MKALTSSQAKYLRGLAHNIKPVVHVGQKGVTAALKRSLEEALNRHELIKVKFIEFKEKEQKKKIAADIEAMNACRLAGMIGHVAIFFRPQKDPKKRKINLPDL